MTKYQLLEKYDLATRLSFNASPADWLKVFPTRRALLDFRADVGSLCWPENFGSSPWENAFSVAYHVANGFSESSKEWYAKYSAQGDRYAIAELAAVDLYLGLAS